MDKIDALTTAFANLKGSKNKDLLATARALAFLKRLPELGSNQRVGDEVGVSHETVREFLKLLELPESVQALIEKRKIGLEHGRRLWQLGRRRPDAVEAASRAAEGLPALEFRNLTDYLIRQPQATVGQALDALKAGRTVSTKEYRVEVRVSEEQFNALVTSAQQSSRSVPALLGDLISDWLATRSSP